MAWGYYREYVPVAKRRTKALREMDRLRKQGRTIEPVQIDGRTIARSFWGKGWCDHLESFSDFANRLPRGRTYVRNGSVCHLAGQPGHIEAIVSGSELYHVDIRITKLEPKMWQAIQRRCAGQVGSMLELLQGRLSDQVMAVVTDRDAGLFPKPRQIEFDCSCPDYASMCKHVAAVLYGIGHRLDRQPDLLFTLRGVDPQELIATEMQLPTADNADGESLAEDQLSDIFGVEMEATDVAPSAAEIDQPSRQPTNKANRKRVKKKRRKKRSTRNVSHKTAPAASTTSGDLHRLRPTGKSVARLRRQLGCTVAEFAQQVGVTTATVHRWQATAGRLRLQHQSLRALERLHRQARKA